MIYRFCLYGFLKNQQYYAPFIILAFRDKGLSYFAIGLLVTVREIVANLCEIPSGAFADIYGRRKAMVISFTAYIVSFFVLAVAARFVALLGAMVCFGLGEAFRSGTHKALIMEWLRHEGRIDERTAVYGLTRSWSRLGSALSSLVAAALVFWSGNYAAIFLVTIIPYLIGIANFIGYPAYLDDTSEEREMAEGAEEQKVVGHLRQLWQLSTTNKGLQGLVIETMCWDGVYKAVKDYLQPVIAAIAIAVPVLLNLEAGQRTAVLIGLVYCGLHLLESRAARGARAFVDRHTSEAKAVDRLWSMRTLVHGVLFAALAFGQMPVAAGCFVCLAVLQNLWRPVQVGRIQEQTPVGHGASVLSLDAQAKTVSTLLCAPLLGLAVDYGGYWAIGLCGLIACIVRFGLVYRHHSLVQSS